MLLVLLDRNDHAKTSCGFNKLKPKEFNKPFSFVCLFLNSWKRKRGNNRDINDNDNDNDFIIWQTAITQRPFLSEESTISIFRRYLPEQLKPKYFGRQIHRKDPLVLWHVDPPIQLCFPIAHSFTSAKQEVLLFSLPFFLNSRLCPEKEYWETVFSNQFDDYIRNWFQSESCYHY